ncbi:hypothetical protein QJS04_geneDACA019097 [Acorus gramineus]|uniref:Neprosin PEP catalytic domain-containing protein n=1 Tax=Acorus gramineus TaxID=55184 RepID=A0AAV9A9A8_ACOGR|nr:hypothetical protein QJS04_geneDACA019097 [Acorus gramineus]
MSEEVEGGLTSGPEIELPWRSVEESDHKKYNNLEIKIDSGIATMAGSDDHVVNGRLILSKEEDEKLIRQLKMFNKPTIKNHPLLKNHSIQIKPSSYPPTSTVYKSSSINKFQNIGIEIDGCPERTILIRRTSKEELIASQRLMSTFSTSLQANGNKKSHWAYVQTNRSRDIYGAKAAISVYGFPELKSPQSTHALIWVISFKTGPETVNTVQAGWHVYPELYGDSQSRFFVCWTDQSTKNWWLTMGPNGVRIGYWPKGIFTWLSEKAHGAIWGGVAGGPKNLPTPPMGSGHFANLGDGKAAYFKKTEEA